MPGELARRLASPHLFLSFAIVRRRGLESDQDLRRGFEKCLKTRLLQLFYFFTNAFDRALQIILKADRVLFGISGCNTHAPIRARPLPFHRTPLCKHSEVV